MKIVKLLFGLSLLCFTYLDSFQAPAPKKASPEKQAAILRLQLQATRIQAAFNSCQQTDFQSQYNSVSLQIQQKVDEALKEAGLDIKAWDLNLDTFEFVNRATTPAPPAPKPAPAEKKP